MQNPRLAARYAKSLLDLAVEQNSIESTLLDMQLLEGVCKASNEFCTMLRSPVIQADKKEAVVSAVLGDKITPLTKSFVHLLVTKVRESALPEIAAAFISQYNIMKKIRTVRLTTATPVDDTVKETIRTKVAANMPDHTIDLQTAVNADLIGGFMLEMDNNLIDASVRRDLADIRKQFLDKSYVPMI